MFHYAESHSGKLESGALFGRVEVESRLLKID